MRFDEIREAASEILQRESAFITSYQVLHILMDDYPDIGRRLVEEYGEGEGVGAGRNYTPVSFVGRALDHFRQQEILPIVRDYLVSRNLRFEGIEPGERGWTAIYRWERPDRE